LKRGKNIIDINKTTLLTALNNMFKTGDITDAVYATESLRGGTVGEVCRISGEAVNKNGLRFPFTLVLKEQKKWERGGDPDSWRREYDIYQKIDDLNSVLPDNIRLPVCYYAEEFVREDTPVWQIYMEDADGISSNKLTLDMLEYAMTELGKFQGYVCKNKPESLQNIACFSNRGFINTERVIFIYKEVADNIEPSDCDMIPEHLRNIITDRIFTNIENTMSIANRLPKTLCHRDMQCENIFLSNVNIITLIDWDCAGWGFIGEDVIQMISELFVCRFFDIADFEKYSNQLLSAYKRGASEYINIDFLTDEIFREVFMLYCGHKIFWRYKYSDTEKEKTGWIALLHKIYETWLI
jgi:hypothetical protein